MIEKKNLLASGPDKTRETPRFGGIEDCLLLQLQRDLQNRPLTVNVKGRGRRKLQMGILGVRSHFWRSDRCVDRSDRGLVMGASLLSVIVNCSVVLVIELLLL